MKKSGSKFGALKQDKKTGQVIGVRSMEDQIMAEHMRKHKTKATPKKAK